MKQNDSGAAPMALASKIKRWDYDKSVAKMRPLIQEWKQATEEVLRELYLAREFLTNQKGQHRDPEAADYILHTWGGYCGELGLSHQTANNWLRPFTPRELSDTGKDVLQLAPPMKEETTASRALAEARIAEVLRTSKRPADWTDEEEAELKRRLENARLTELAEKCNVPTYFKENDYFSEALRRAKDITNFKLQNSTQIQAQYKVFKHIEEYLDAFEDPEIRARAAFNLALKTRNLANAFAEMNFHLNEANSGPALKSPGKRVKTVKEEKGHNLRLKIEFFNDNGSFSFGMDTWIGQGGIGHPAAGHYKSLEEAERAALAHLYKCHKDPIQKPLIKKLDFVKQIKQRQMTPPQTEAGNGS